MPSKTSTFDFFRQFSAPKNGVHIFVTSDPFIETFLKNRLKEISKFDLITGTELTRNFLEERYSNLSLFSEASNVLVLNGEAIAEKTFSFWLEDELLIEDQLLIILANKEHKQFAKLEAKKLVKLHLLEAPKFWEGAKVLDLVLQELGYEVAPVYKELILEKVENTFEDFHQLIVKLMLIKPQGFKFDRDAHQENQKILAENIEENKVDFFKLVDVLNQSPRKFFYTIQKSERDFDYYLSLALFMQGHVQKSKFPELVKEKSKLSQYDRQILQTTDAFNEKDRAKLEEVFSEMEIMAKMKSPYLKQFIRLNCMP